MTSPFGTTRPAPGIVSAADQQRVATFMRGVFAWMCGGLVITAAAAWGVAGSQEMIDALVRSSPVFYGLIIAELVLVWYLSARVASMAPATAGALFVLYSALNGVTFSVILLVFTAASVTSTFFVAAAMFGSLALYGAVTKRDLTAVGRFMFMGLIGLILVSVIGFWWHSDALQFSLGVVGVLVFAGLTAYDTQRLQRMALEVQGEQAQSYAIAGALSLYLDFVNLFLSLLRIFGRRR